MVRCGDHDAQQRNLEIYTLRCVGMDALALIKRLCQVP